MLFLLGFLRGLWTLAATVATAFCLFEHAWLCAALWTLSTLVASTLCRACVPRPMLVEAPNYDAIGDRVFDRMAERVDARR